MRFFLIFATLVALSLSTPAFGASCAPREYFVKSLSKTYKEVPVAVGVAAGGSLLEVFASANDDRSWSILITTPNKVTCLVSSGEGWQTREPEELKGPHT